MLQDSINGWEIKALALYWTDRRNNESYIYIMSIGDEEILLVEPFYGGSHKQLIDLLYERIPGCLKVTMSSKKWHWRSRTAALHLSNAIPRSDCFRVLFSSSVLNLAELVALRPDLAKLRKILYFHENQLTYPVRKNQERDFQYGYNQILSSLVADIIVFNSHYNMESFLGSIKTFMKLMPDYRPKDLAEQIKPKCQVIHFPLHFPQFISREEIVSDKASCPVGNRDVNQSCTTGNKDIKQSFPTGNMDVNQSCATGNKDIKQSFPTGNMDVNQSCPIGNKRVTTEDMKSVLQTQPVVYDVTGLEDFSKGQSCNVTGKAMAINPSNQISVDDLNTDSSIMSTPEKTQGQTTLSQPLHVLWPHRWEHDKDPETFLTTMLKLHENNLDFRLSVLGEQFTDVPDIFEAAKSILKDKILHWGHQDSKLDYYQILAAADVVVSTSLHEFFGVAMLEAVYYKCFPLCPNRLVYPEIFPKCYLYNTPVQLYKTLKRFCLHPHLVRNHQLQMSPEIYLWDNVAVKFVNLFERDVT